MRKLFIACPMSKYIDKGKFTNKNFKNLLKLCIYLSRICSRGFSCVTKRRIWEKIDERYLYRTRF